MSKRSLLLSISILIVVALASACGGTPTPTATPVTITPTSTPTSSPTPTATPSPFDIEILVDDFLPQPYQGAPTYFYNRIGGDRGALNDSLMELGQGRMTTTIASGQTWGGAWMSLNHPIRETLPLDFAALLPEQLLPDFQAAITDLKVRVANGTPGRTLKLELKDRDQLRWQDEIVLEGGPQEVTFSLPANVGKVNHFVWVLDNASPGDSVVLEQVSFTAATPITDTATRAFVWSYGQFLANWNPATGQVRDKAHDASGEFDATQTTGSLAAATALAAQLGVVSHDDAVAIVNRIGQALLVETPRYHGLLPHFVRVSDAGAVTIVPETEWSSVDTVIAAIGLLTAQSSLGLDNSATEALLQQIDWDDLTKPDGMISMGYTYAGERIPWAWDTFGGESWLVELAYAAATGRTAPLTYPSPPTANGSGFIDELAWLFVPPPLQPDAWGTDWTAYRSEAAGQQIRYYPDNYPGSCLAQLNLSGLSAAEVPDPALVPSGQGIYQSFGLGGRSTPNDGHDMMGSPVVVPHYSALIASLQPQEATAMWEWLSRNGFFSPLNNVESLMFSTELGCDPDAAVWNHLKGSWNLALQTLGWGRYLAERDEQVPVLWQAATTNPFLSEGYRLLTQEPESWPVSRECEYPDESNVGQVLERAGASAGKVQGQFGTKPAWPAQPGDVRYTGIMMPQTETLYLRLRYSKFSPPSTPILIFLDDETTPRASIVPVDQGSWETFAWTEPILLGSVAEGVHALKFATEGQEYGVADLDVFTLSDGP